MSDIFTSVLANGVYALLILILISSFSFLLNVQPTRLLWKLKDYKNLIIVTANSVKTNTGIYHRPATGIGQVKALSFIISSLNQAYRKMEMTNIVFSGDSIGENIEKDLISIGGPKNNLITKDLLEKVKPLSIVEQVGNEIHWKVEGQASKYRPYIESEQVKSDVGLIIRMVNPYSDNKTTLTVFSGSHTFGTIASAKYFTRNLLKDVKKFKSLGKIYIAVIQCEVIDGSPARLTLLREYISKKTLNQLMKPTIDQSTKVGEV